MIDTKDIYIVNSNYILKNDEKRVILCYRYNACLHNPTHYIAETVFCSYIHPEQAKIFSLFDGKNTLFQVITAVAERLDLSQERAEKLILPYIENEDRLSVVLNGTKFIFPKNFIVPLKESAPVHVYKENDFNYDSLDFNNYRLYTFPLEVTLMVNTLCLVDCIYCYADCRKKMDCQIPIETLDKLISDCQQNNIRSFNLMGGEVLKYKNWKWLVFKLLDCGFTPFISTKIPIDSCTIKELYDLGIREFQISLDSFDSDVLEKNLHIVHGKRYIEKMRKTLAELEKIGINIHVHAVITRHNRELSHLKEYLHELNSYRNISNLQLSIAADSLYKDNYLNHRINKDEIKLLSSYVKEIKESNAYPFNINMSGGFLKENYLENKENKKNIFQKRGLCSANVRQVFILPNGDVTFCEELMFHPQFILGNVIEQDLQTIWKNNKLKTLEGRSLYADSRCGKCKEFDKCKGSASKGVCWKEILHAYGSDKWNYPDPKCPYAPEKMRPFYVE
jgi:radical SAM protein with 4Fe4S-binding SPASM domain